MITQQQQQSQAQNSRSRVIHINQALSNIHGPQIKSLAIDMINHKAKITKELENTTDLDKLKQFLEEKIGRYVKDEYDNKYGKLEKFKSFEAKNQEKFDFDFFQGEKGVDQLGDHFGSRIRMIRGVNSGVDGVNENWDCEDDDDYF